MVSVLTAVKLVARFWRFVDSVFGTESLFKVRRG